MSDDVKDFAHYANAAERVIATIQDDMPTADVAVIAAIAQVFATLATGAPKSSTHVDPEPCGSLHDVSVGNGHIELSTPTWCRYKHGHEGAHQCICCMYQWLVCS